MPVKKVKVNLKEKSYEIFIGKGILPQANKYIKKLPIGKKILIVTQSKVPKTYLTKLRSSLTKAGFKVFTISLKSGEQYKDLNSLLQITNCAIKNKFERDDSLISLGGGVISDLTGLAASIYYRGINFISIPTTLLAMVDAAVGGKTGINIKQGKNLLGTFYQPKVVLIDTNTLKTLPKKELLVGMAEVIKYAFLENTAKTKFKKQSFFSYLVKNREKILELNDTCINDIIYYSCIVKASVVSKDEKESNLRAILNHGHTFAHGIEQAYKYKTYSHGEAVSIGMCYAAILAEEEGYINKSIVNQTIELISSYGLPTTVKDKKKTTQVMQSMLLDKKVKNGKLRFILPNKKIGAVKIVSNINNKKVKAILIKS